jgi:hypothetical protein
MKTEAIIEGLNRYIDEYRKLNNITTKGHLVLQKIIEPKAFKVYKEGIYTLWFILNRKKYEVLKLSKIDKIQEGQEETLYRALDIELIKEIFKLITSDKFRHILTSTYGNKE